ncbi:MAG: hypothetical protein JKY54_08760 [Flavobacteriales bacterium]|nr:hypothetical protein [Flavobacteriales bacterium]
MRILFFLLALFFSFNAFAQTIESATSQRWAGGICCKTGVKYIVYLDTKIPVDQFSIESIWLKNYGLVTGGHLYVIPNKENQILVSFGTQHNHRIDHDLKTIEEQNHYISVMPEFNGNALIILRKGKQEIKLEIDQFQSISILTYPKSANQLKNSQRLPF